MQLTNKITVARNIRIHQRSCFQFRGCGHNDKNSQTTGKATQLLSRGIQFISEHLVLSEHTSTKTVGKPVSILRCTAEIIVALGHSLAVCSVLVRLVHDFRADSP